MEFSTDPHAIYLVYPKPNNYMEGLIFGQTAQISTNKGIEVFGDAGAHAVHKEMKQLHDQQVPIPVEPAKLSCDIIIDAL